jgi:hypothetical protein
MGNAARVHMDKFVYGNCFLSLLNDGLAEIENADWVLVEESCAAEIMAALALSRCEAADKHRWSRQGGAYPERWVPVADDEPSTLALLSGLRPIANDQDMKVELRVRGQLQLAEIYSIALPAIFPVPRAQ